MMARSARSVRVARESRRSERAVGAPRRPRSNGYGGLSVGFAGLPASEASSAVSSPTMKLTGYGRDPPPHAVPPFGKSSRDRRTFSSGISRDGDHDLARADGGRGGEGSVEDEVRGEPKEHLVLAACRLTFRPVDDDDGPSALLRHRTELRGGRESRRRPVRAARSRLRARSRSTDPGSGPYRAWCSCRRVGRPSARSPERSRLVPAGGSVSAHCGSPSRSSRPRRCAADRAGDRPAPARRSRGGSRVATGDPHRPRQARSPSAPQVS